MALSFDIQIGADTTQAQRALRELDTQSDQARRSVDRMHDELADSPRRTGPAVGALGGISNAIKGLGVAAAAYAALNFARTINDEMTTFTNMTNQLSTVLETEREIRQQRQEIFEISQNTMTDFETNVNAYTRLSRALRETDFGNEEILQVLENLNTLATTAGQTQEEIAAGTQQLMQGLSSGELQGDELRSVLENLPTVAQTIADELGVTIGELREMGSEGELTAERIVEALSGNIPEAQAALEDFQKTTDQSFQQLSNAWTNFVGQVMEDQGVQEAFTGLIDTFTGFLENEQAIEGFRGGIEAIIEVVNFLIERVERLGEIINGVIETIETMATNIETTINRISDVEYLAPSRAPGEDPLGGEEPGDYTPEGNPGLGAMLPGRHEGGIVGVTPPSSWHAVDPSIFAGAPRLHNGLFPGLASDEFPTILQRGEMVIPADAVAGMTSHQGDVAPPPKKPIAEELRRALH
jgi:tape measure domain-containing protein